MLYQPHSMVKRKKRVFLWKSLQRVDQGKHVVDAKTCVLHLQEARNMKENSHPSRGRGRGRGRPVCWCRTWGQRGSRARIPPGVRGLLNNKFVILTTRQLSLSLFLEQLTDSDEASETKKQSILDSAASEEHEEDERQHLKKVVKHFSWYSNIFWL